MKVDRCYCYQTLFADLKEVANATGAQTVEDLQDHVVFGHNCQLCHPYVRTMLRTGETVFSRIIKDPEGVEG